MDARKGAGLKQARALNVEQEIQYDDAGYLTGPQTVIWQPIPAAPQDGRPLMVKEALEDAGPGMPAMWHRTRRWTGRGWQHVGFWANPHTKWPLNFSPQYWRFPVYGAKR